MKIGWIGVHEEGIPALDAVCSSGYQVQGVMTLGKDAAALRAGSANYQEICRPYNVPVYEISHINDASSLEILKGWDCDLLVVLGWGQILSPEVLRLPRLGAVGAHASLLPHNRGSAPVNWAIINGESEAGNSLIWLAADVDAGDLIDQKSFPISQHDTCRTIYDAVAESNREMILPLLKQLSEGQRPGTPQQPSDEQVLPRRKPKDGVINWSDSTQQIYDLVRAVTKPYPGAKAVFQDQSYTIWTAAALPSLSTDATPGTVLGPVKSARPEGCGQLIATGDGALLILEAESANGRILTGFELCEQNWADKGLARAA